MEEKKASATMLLYILMIWNIFRDLFPYLIKYVPKDV